jgi:hypothetical protein
VNRGQNLEVGAAQIPESTLVYKEKIESVENIFKKLSPNRPQVC